MVYFAKSDLKCHCNNSDFIVRGLIPPQGFTISNLLIKLRFLILQNPSEFLRNLLVN